MTGFFTRFFICNFFIAIFICFMLTAKWLLRKHLSARMQYNLWFILHVLFLVPFLPSFPDSSQRFFSLLGRVSSSSFTGTGSTSSAAGTGTSATSTAGWMNDFAMSAVHNSPSVLSSILLVIWVVGIMALSLYFLHSRIQLRRLERTALPLQSETIRTLYLNCVREMHLKKAPPVFSTAYLSSPATAGLIRPRIYLPHHLISDFHGGRVTETELHYMLLHELQHYRHADAAANHLMNLAKIIYWFNPLVWTAMQKMQCDREIACDASVLQMLTEEEYTRYGNTLISLAAKISSVPLSFSAPMAGSKKQITKRILHIAAYRPQSRLRRLGGTLLWLLLTFVLLGLSPVLSIRADVAKQGAYPDPEENVTYIDLASSFDGYEGSFVLFDTKTDSWQIYNQELASRRVSPNSTYKIYDALLGLESGIITPAQSQMAWDGTEQPFDAWNADQNLNSAMQNSVNWYFQSIDRQAGTAAVKDYFHEIGYGNEDVSGNPDSYWMESSLKISPIEQTKLLKKLYYNEFGFEPQNIQAVKDAMYLSSNGQTSLYGKTGTGAVDGREVNGWFTGYISQPGHVSFFTVNIQGEKDAAGSKAAEIALNILDPDHGL